MAAVVRTNNHMPRLTGRKAAPSKEAARIPGVAPLVVGFVCVSEQKKSKSSAQERSA